MQARTRKRAYTVFAGRDEVFRCHAHSEKEAIDEFEGTLDGTLDEYAAEKGLSFEDITARTE